MFTSISYGHKIVFDFSNYIIDYDGLSIINCYVNSNYLLGYFNYVKQVYQYKLYSTT